HDLVQALDHKFTSSYRSVGLKNIATGVVQSLDILRGHSAIAFCGIAQPESFLKSVESNDVKIKKFVGFSDHHQFSAEEIESIISIYHEQKADFIMTTEKDAVRLDQFKNLFSQISLVALQVKMEIAQQHEWKNFLLQGCEK
ncbi:MAG: tetraacyldisaccharide 4'-kinase, partial [Bacteroidota bacterium]|nr:tetraacyldisaccharide 4'-kinase [Bacteroidota bacterium]